jgi:hypothetical protein
VGVVSVIRAKLSVNVGVVVSVTPKVAVEVNVSVYDRVAVTNPVGDGVGTSVGVPELVGERVRTGLVVILVVIAGVGARGFVRRTHTRDIITHNPHIPSMSRAEALEAKSTLLFFIQSFNLSGCSTIIPQFSHIIRRLLILEVPALTFPKQPNLGSSGFPVGKGRCQAILPCYNHYNYFRVRSRWRTK